MKVAPIVIAIIGILVVAFGVINHFASFVRMSGQSHGDLIIAVIGVIVFLVGAVMVYSTRRPRPRSV